MCGIAGGYFFQTKNIDQSTFENALNTLSKRGPDATGIYENQQVLLGHKRLSIIDTSEGANQPFFDDRNQYVIVFNGEIFNYAQLKKDKLSHYTERFKTSSDSEVLLYLLIEYGSDCLNWLTGFFAFAFYNIQTGEMLLARDRYGKKPMVLYQDEQQLLFASELKAIMPLMPKKEMDTTSVALYFQLNYLPPTQSILKNVRKLQPGHFITIKNQEVTENSYYTLALHPQTYTQYTYSEACEQLVQLMSKSVEERMISDVPLGAFLSGGIDSSVVVALASQFTSRLNTFSIGYKDNPLFDETKYANLVAKKYQTEHQVFYLTEKDYKEELYSILDYLDEPFADSSCIPTYILCKKTKAFVTVALSGDGGDEVFAGYNKHKAEYVIRKNKLMGLMAGLGSPLWKLLPQNKNTKTGNYVRQLAKLGEGAMLSKGDRHIRWSSILGQTEVQSLFADSFKQKIQQDAIHKINQQYASLIHTDDFNEVLLTDMNLVLPGDMLHKVDMMSMANSLEIRSPFLDAKVVDFAFGLPASYKIDNQLKKKIVQDAFRNHLPPELYNRPKQGFEIPLLEWFRNDLNDYIFNDLLEKKFIEAQQIFSYEKITSLKQKLHSNNPGYVQATLWALIVFQHWYKQNKIA
ncbi:MAG: asparagine synthase (glutamine-hydrolyzing) [Bacteroidetes bacterium]|jgi:asparagine synthase (glutamine-hydrolysing)|nr:asparagine synthase (glutamine-hydrolyzing) [Bacteroidota bacterium]MBK9302194.1 asparagine synthase (glutamine-hydrolyzing) [Bacteroidota bacterium]